MLSFYFHLEEQYGLSLKVIYPAGEIRLTKRLSLPDTYSTIFKS